MSNETDRMENRARMFFANVFDTGLMALDLAKVATYTRSPREVAERLRQMSMDANRIAAALETSETFSAAMWELQKTQILPEEAFNQAPAI